jgi:hypothetical protein
VALVHIELLLLVEVVHPHPRVGRAAGDEAALSAVQRDAGDLVGGLDAFDEAARVEAVEEVGAVAGGDAEDAACATASTTATATVVAAAVGGREGVELAAADGAVEVVLGDGRARAQVPPADHPVVGGGDEDVEVGAPDDGLDGAAVDARADFVAGGRGRGTVGGVAVHRGGAHAVRAGGGGGGAAGAAGEVEDAEFLLGAAGGEDLRAGLGGEGDGADDVRVLEGVQAFAGVGVPDFAVEGGWVSMVRLSRGLGEVGRTLRSRRTRWLLKWRRGRDGLARRRLCGL